MPPAIDTRLGGSRRREGGASSPELRIKMNQNDKKIVIINIIGKNTTFYSKWDPIISEENTEFFNEKSNIVVVMLIFKFV